MSMLPAQCDELRERAKVLRQGRWSDGADDARLMEDAADTIWELRGMVHKERAENEKLREDRDHWHVEQVHAYGNWEDAHKRAIELEKQNAKLRELVMAAWRCIHTGASCSDCRLVAGGCTLQSAMRELEVDA